ncbi:hypothetical protein ASE07_22400 [Noviherbaspirillum sp. Root189]|nr:hypothetical protein ASE07_22400 [Noviherbaspirillum sp. Root189]
MDIILSDETIADRIERRRSFVNCGEQIIFPGINIHLQLKHLYAIMFQRSMVSIHLAMPT